MVLPDADLLDPERLGTARVRRILAADMREVLGAEYDDFASVTSEDVRAAFEKRWAA